MNTDRFALRHIGPRRADLQLMLDTIGVASIDQLIHETIPAGIRLKNDLELDPVMSEYEFSSHINELGKENKQYRSFIGLGYNAAIVPAVIQRNILEKELLVLSNSLQPGQCEVCNFKRNVSLELRSRY
jgi:glycine dehydrogenase